MNLKIVEIFHSIQGEGYNSGMSAIFIRLSNCNLNCSFCDTDWSKGDVMTIKEIKDKISKYNCKNIIWTGGEPTLQLDKEILSHFSEYFNCIETNGTRKVPEGIDYISCSPKIGYEMLHDIFPDGVDEFRYVSAYKLPDISLLPKATNYYISPLFLGKEKDEINFSHINKCIEIVKKENKWKLSIQIHKILKVR